MKKLFTILLLLLTFTCYSQGEYGVRFKLVSEDVYCGQQYCPIIQVKSNNGVFNASDFNLRFEFDTTLVGAYNGSNVWIEEETNFSGIEEHPTGAISSYLPHNLNGSLGNIISYNIVLGGGVGYPIDTSWIDIGQICFEYELDDCTNIIWHTDALYDYPRTIITEQIGGLGGTLKEADGTIFLNSHECFSKCNLDIDIESINIKTDGLKNKILIETSGEYEEALLVSRLENKDGVLCERYIDSTTKPNPIIYDNDPLCISYYKIRADNGFERVLQHTNENVCSELFHVIYSHGNITVQSELENYLYKIYNIIGQEVKKVSLSNFYIVYIKYRDYEVYKKVSIY